MTSFPGTFDHGTNAITFQLTFRSPRRIQTVVSVHDPERRPARLLWRLAHARGQVPASAKPNAFPGAPQVFLHRRTGKTPTRPALVPYEQRDPNRVQGGQYILRLQRRCSIPRTAKVE